MASEDPLGLEEVGWLLEDHHENVCEDIGTLVGKSEEQLVSLVRKVVIHSRVVSKRRAAEAARREEAAELAAAGAGAGADASADAGK